jgi:hypothetical protein
MRLQSYKRNINKHFWHYYRGRQLSLSVYRLSKIALVNIINLTELSFALCLLMVLTGKCMTKFNLMANYHTDLESLLRKSRSRLSSPGSFGSYIREIIDQFQRPTTPVEPLPMVATAHKCINDFSASSSANIKTGLEMNVRDDHIEFKARLINMVQQSQINMVQRSSPTFSGVNQDVV